MLDKKELLSQTIEHVDITGHDPVPLVEAMGRMAFSASNRSRPGRVYWVQFVLAEKAIRPIASTSGTGSCPVMSTCSIVCDSSSFLSSMAYGFLQSDLARGIG